VITASTIAVVLGLVGSGVLTARLTRRRLQPVGSYWALGLIGLLPGWVVAFWGLLGPTVGRPRPGSGVAWILSSTAGLLGVIVTDAIARRRRAAPEATGLVRNQWLLGVMALAPAWIVALVGLAWNPH
jgi:hypothetical protein